MSIVYTLSTLTPQNGCTDYFINLLFSFEEHVVNVYYVNVAKFQFTLCLGSMEKDAIALLELANIRYFK